MEEKKKVYNIPIKGNPDARDNESTGLIVLKSVKDEILGCKLKELSLFLGLEYKIIKNWFMDYAETFPPLPFAELALRLAWATVNPVEKGILCSTFRAIVVEITKVVTKYGDTSQQRYYFASEAEALEFMTAYYKRAYRTREEKRLPRLKSITFADRTMVIKGVKPFSFDDITPADKGEKYSFAKTEAYEKAKRALHEEENQKKTGKPSKTTLGALLRLPKANSGGRSC